MSANIADRVLEITTITGLGTYSLDGPGTGYQTFVAGIGDGAKVWYAVTDNTDWEVGIGTITGGAPDTISRDTILHSSNADSAVSWSAGTKYIFANVPGDAVKQIPLIFATLADLDACPFLYPGLEAKILGRHNVGDPGSMDYVIVAAATGTDNGGDYIDLATSGLQAKALFPNKDINVWHFGGGTGTPATDDAALAAMNASLLATHDANLLLNGTVRQYYRNVSNAAGAGNLVTASAGVDTTLQLNGDGTNNTNSSNCDTGKLQFDSTYNGNLGAFIVDNINDETMIRARWTFVNTGSPTTATAKMFLVFNKATPGTGIAIASSPFSVSSGVEQTVEFSAFHGGIEAIYFQINSAAARDYQVNGALVTLIENR